MTEYPVNHQEQWHGNIGIADANDLPQVFELQQSNLGRNVSSKEQQDQGYVSVETTPQMIEEINESDGVTVAKESNKVVGYVMPLPVKQGGKIPLLEPFIERFAGLEIDGRPLTDLRYVIVGQVCVDKEHRGQGIVEQLYKDFIERMAEKYDIGITEVGATNPRSYHVHVEKIGMKVLQKYEADGKEWYILAVDFRPFRKSVKREVADEKK